MVNPIVTFAFYFGIAITIILSKTWQGLGIYYAVCIFLLLYIKRIKLIFKQVKPFIFFLPILIFIYIVISFIFTEETWYQILNEAGLAVFKLLLLLTIMSIYIELSKEYNLVLAIRSLCLKLKLKWKWVDDLFVFLELTLRFYPSFQQEWNAINRSKIALGIKQKINKWDRIKSIANDLPGLIVQSYKKAENTANIMKQRGYGKIVPRGIAYPIPFKVTDTIFLILLIIGYFTLNHYVAV